MFEILLIAPPERALVYSRELEGLGCPVVVSDSPVALSGGSPGSRVLVVDVALVASVGKALSARRRRTPMIMVVVNGERRILENDLFSEFLAVMRPKSADPWSSILTPAQLRIADLASRGLSDAEIARRSQVSVATVKFHLRNIYQRLGCRTRTQLTALRHAVGSASEHTPRG